MNGTAQRAPGWTDTWRAPALVAVAAALAFLPSLWCGFVWDDHRFIAENPSVVHPTSWLRFLTDANTVDALGAMGIVRPLRTLEFAVDYALFGDSPFAFHLHSLLWHVAASAVLCLMLRRLLGHGGAAVVAALFFAVNPTQSECVAFVSSRGDLAMGAFSFASLFFALKSEGFDRNLVISLATALVAMLYKEAAVALPFIVVALRMTKLARVSWWPYFVADAGYFVYRVCVETSGTQGVPFDIGGSRIGTIATMVRGFGYYLVQPLLPAQSLEWYLSPSTSFADAAVIAWLVVHVAIVASAVLARRSAPLWTLAVVWFYAFLGPVSNVLISVGMPTCERFLYASVGAVALAIGWALVRAPRGARAAALVAVAALAAGTLARMPMWRNDAAMWAAVLADHDSARAHNATCVGLRREALALRDKMEKMPPGDERAAALARTKALLEEALDHAHRAIANRYEFEMATRSVTQVTRLSEMLASSVCHLLLRDEEALFHAEEALRIHPTLDGDAEYDRALPLFALGYAPQGIAALRRAAKLRGGVPDEEMTGYFIRAGEACEAGGLLDSAAEGYAGAVDVAPPGPSRDDAQARLDAVRRRPRAKEAGALERARLAQMDEALARLPKTCPVVRYPSIAK
jgi:tetratricopeptide (TPR) repeat protein